MSEDNVSIIGSGVSREELDRVWSVRINAWQSKNPVNDQIHAGWIGDYAGGPRKYEVQYVRADVADAMLEALQAIKAMSPGSSEIYQIAKEAIEQTKSRTEEG